MRVLASVLFSAVLCLSCGSSEDTGTGGTAQDNPNLGGGGSPQGCDGAWKSYVKTRPTGLLLKYEASGSGRLEIHTTEVTASTDTSVTEIHRSSTSGTSESTTTKAEFLTTCRQGTGTNPGQPPSGTLEELKKVAIRVRAGEFATTYVRMRSVIDPENDVTAVSEVWSADNDLHFLVKQITVTELSGTRYEVKTELIEARIP
jgi:ABC-type phosphate transport system substrate-binding protein